MCFIYYFKKRPRLFESLIGKWQKPDEPRCLHSNLPAYALYCYQEDSYKQDFSLSYNTQIRQKSQVVFLKKSISPQLYFGKSINSTSAPLFFSSTKKSLNIRNLDRFVKGLDRFAKRFSF